MPSLNEITVSQLSRLIGTHDSPVIIDLRVDKDFDLNPKVIPSARRHSFENLDSLATQLRASRAVVYCNEGKKISQGACAVLHNHGIKAEYLVGGHVAWSDARHPLVPYVKIPTTQNKNHSVWVTRHRPKIDRIACPWLIRRFIDPNAEFLFVTPNSIMDIAELYEATPFDIEDVFWSHRGTRCTFDIMIEEFELNTEPLLQLATIVRGADTDQLALAPQSAGLLAASLGLSRMYRDDLEQLDAGLLLYDAFYRWARDATDEGHDWPLSKTGH
ncbi:MAG: sulfurtransferase [marine bacterium B5-7]|nr:MAG: sulfurtransferase [marine bacterium B5-7]